jgi:uncharacterized protein HemY
MKIIFYVIILSLAILFGLMIKIDPGYVLIAYHHWTAEMPLWFAIIAVAIIFLLFHYGIRIWIAIANIGERWHIWKIKRHFYREHPLTNNGFMDLIAENWENLVKSLPQLKKLRLLNDENYTKLATKIYANLFTKQHNLASVKKMWRRIPATLHKTPEIIAAYAKALLKFDENKLAESILEKQLKNTWHESLIQLYGLTKTPHSLKQLKILENFVSAHRHNQELLLALGRVAIRCKLWAKADEYLSAYLKINQDPIACALLGFVREQQGEDDQAIDAYHQSSNLAI